jgi:hypothetical protein
MSEMDIFHCVFLSMKEESTGLPKKHGRHGKASRIATNPRPTSTTASRDLTMALQKIKMKKDVNPMKILA